MLQEGGTGILEALKGYNPGKARFEVYAAYFVKGQIYSYIANWSGVSRHSMENLSRLNRVLAKLSMRGCENPDAGTIAAEMGVSPQVAKNLLRLRRQFENAGEESLADLRCPERDEPERAAEANELSKTLWTAFGKLPFLQRKILRLCYIVEWVKGRKPSDTSVGDRTGMKGHKVSEERESALRTLGRNQKLRKLYLGEEPRSDQELVIEVEPRSRTNAIQTSAEITEIKI
jgi:RNA polymerase sigma factor (sigma-70 family)